MEKHFKTIDDAKEAGYITVADARILCHVTKAQVNDTSGGNKFGYEYTMTQGDQIITKTETIWMDEELNKIGHPCAFEAMFYVPNIIPDGLKELTTTKTAELLGIEPASVRQAVISGKLPADHIGPRAIIIRKIDALLYQAGKRKPGKQKVCSRND